MWSTIIVFILPLQGRTQNKWTILRIYRFVDSSSCHLLHSITQASLCNRIAAIHHLPIHLQESLIHHVQRVEWRRPWTQQKNTRHKKCLCTVQTGKKLPFQYHLPCLFLSRNPVCARRDWSGLRESLRNVNLALRFSVNLIEVPSGGTVGNEPKWVFNIHTQLERRFGYKKKRTLMWH